MKKAFSLFCILLNFSLFADTCCYTPAGNLGMGYEFFRSLPEGDWEGNTGSLVSFNLGLPTGCDVFGLQFGTSYGVYDWQGKISAIPGRENTLQQQLFMTAGFFDRTPYGCGFNYGLVFDWMWNKGMGIFGVNANFGQLRGQIGYQINSCNEIGVWATIDPYRYTGSAQGITTKFRALAQINAFWRHIFANRSDITFWAGMPYKKSLAFNNGRAGKFIVGASIFAPISYNWGIEGHASYMAPRFGAPLGQRYYASNICIELKYRFCHDKSWFTPYLPLANNSNFITDTNVVF